MLDFITWNADPTAFTIGTNSIRWYGILMAIGFYIGYFLLIKILKKDQLEENKIHLLAIFIFIGTIVGLRLGHCLFYEPGYYFNNPMEIFKVWQGGLASHGGAIGILLAVYIFSRTKKVSYLWLLDRLVIIIPLVGAMVRMGNLMNSEIIGKVTLVPWAFKFVRVDPIFPRHPSQIYEIIICLALFALLMWIYYKTTKKNQVGFIFGVFLVVLFGARIFIEFFKDIQVPFEYKMPLNMGQILSIPFILFGIYLLYKSRKKVDTEIISNTNQEITKE